MTSGHARGAAPQAASRRTLLRGALAGVGTLPLSACDKLPALPAPGEVLRSAQHLSHTVHRVVAGRNAMAQQFNPAEVAAHFCANGTLVPADADYHALLHGGFADWKPRLGGLVEKPAAFTLGELQAMPARTQITRHDCVEGWSSIGKWKGVPFSRLLAQVKPLPNANFVVFHCADSMDGSGQGARDSRYYESVDLDDADHAQTVLTYELNDQPLQANNGAPLRVRIERQFGYKHAKHLMRIELVERLAGIRGGKGGYWEDLGYHWYAGI
ncbi:MAG: molybdopterin-dependent oxidoreductase [Rhizobacter sp.]|nr:molybdopterin-dependent oxidoreductase [Rhizobacter sp.]